MIACYIIEYDEKVILRLTTIRINYKIKFYLKILKSNVTFLQSYFNFDLAIKK